MTHTSTKATTAANNNGWFDTHASESVEISPNTSHDRVTYPEEDIYE